MKLHFHTWMAPFLFRKVRRAMTYSKKCKVCLRLTPIQSCALLALLLMVLPMISYHYIFGSAISKFYSLSTSKNKKGIHRFDLYLNQAEQPLKYTINLTKQKTQFQKSSQTAFTGFVTDWNQAALENGSESAQRSYSTKGLQIAYINFQKADKGQPISLSPKRDCGDLKFDTRDADLQKFKPALTGQNLCKMLDTMDAFSAALTKAGIAFFMYSGTLIGSWRHHGLVPWDDDVDFAVPIDFQQDIYRSLRDLSPRFILDVKQKRRWKLYEKNSLRIPGKSWKYPFLDINFYHKNDTHVWDHDLFIFKKFIYPSDWIFPLSPRPFNGRMLMAPQQPERTLWQTYNLKNCSTGNYNHRKETLRFDLTSVPCTRLYKLLPFVKRIPVNDGCNETLVQNEEVISYHFFQYGKC